MKTRMTVLIFTSKRINRSNPTRFAMRMAAVIYSICDVWERKNEIRKTAQLSAMPQKVLLFTRASNTYCVAIRPIARILSPPEIMPACIRLPYSLKPKTLASTSRMSRAARSRNVVGGLPIFFCVTGRFLREPAS